MKSILALSFVLLLSVHASASTACGTISSVAVRAAAGGSSEGDQVGGLTFTLSSGKSFSPQIQVSAKDDTNTLTYADPFPAAMTAMLSAAFVNHTIVCYNTATQTLSLNVLNDKK
jgi:hypothetical protein